MGITPISVIIPVRNEGDRLIRAARSIVAGRSCCFPLELVVVDDASSDGTCDRLQDELAAQPETSVILRTLPSWSGIPFARNRGAEAASYPIYVITDANTSFPRNWDLPIWRHCTRERILAATIADMASFFKGFGCALMLPSMGVTWIPVPHAYGGYVPISPCTGTIIERGLFHQLGGYDESLPLYGAAEPELSVRAWLCGYEILTVPELQIYHRFRPRAEHDAFLASIDLVQLHNYLRFACYYLPDDLLPRTCDYYARLHPDTFRQVWSDLYGSDVWKRRAMLASVLRRDFRWFARRFPCLWNGETRG